MVLYNSLFCLSIILSMIFYDFPVCLRNQLISAGSDPSNPYLKPCIVMYYRHFSTNSKVKSSNMNTSFVRLGLCPFGTNKTGKQMQLTINLVCLVLTMPVFINQLRLNKSKQIYKSNKCL